MGQRKRMTSKRAENLLIRRRGRLRSHVRGTRLRRRFYLTLTLLVTTLKSLMLRLGGLPLAKLTGICKELSEAK